MPNKTGPALDELDDQIIDLVGTHIRRRKAEYEKVAIRLKNKLRDDVVRYSDALDAGKINKEDFEMLIRGRYAQLKIELLEQASVSRAKFDLITADVVRLIIRTGLDASKTV